MNQKPKTEKKPKTKSKLEIRDLNPKKDPKAGDAGDGKNIRKQISV